MNTTITEPVFTDTELPAEESVRPFRPSGLLCAALGLISACALASTSLLVIPFVAILVGIYAIRPARDPKHPPTGRAFAVFGIAAALFFAVWSWSYFRAKDHYLVQDGQVFALQWLETLRHGPIEFAYELTQPASARQMDTMPLDQFYTPDNEMAYEQFETFRTGVASAITSAPTDPKWEFQELVDRYERYQSQYIILSFADTTETVSPMLVILCCSPTLDPLGKPDLSKPVEWHVSEFTSYSPQ